MKDFLYVDLDDTTAHLRKSVLEVEPNMEWCDREFNRFMSENRHFFLDLKPVEGAIETIKRLDRDYEILFLSTPMWDIEESFTDKCLWVKKHFGDWSRDRLILSKRKNLSIGKFLVDDHTWNGASEFTGEHLQIFTERFPTWLSVENYLVHQTDYFQKGNRSS